MFLCINFYLEIIWEIYVIQIKNTQSTPLPIVFNPNIRPLNIIYQMIFEIFFIINFFFIFDYIYRQILEFDLKII